MRNYDRIGLRNSRRTQYPTFELADYVESYYPFSLLVNMGDQRNIVHLASLLGQRNVTRSGEVKDILCYVEGV